MSDYTYGIGEVAWLPDSLGIVYTDDLEVSGKGLCLAMIEGGEPKVLADCGLWNFAVSADAQWVIGAGVAEWITGARGERLLPLAYGVIGINIDTGTRWTLRTAVAAAPGTVTSPVGSPLVTYSLRDTLYQDPRHRLAMSPDGKWVAYTAQYGDKDRRWDMTCLVSTEGDDATEVSVRGLGAGPEWSYASNWFTGQERMGEVMNVFGVGVQGSVRWQMSEQIRITEDGSMRP